MSVRPVSNNVYQTYEQHNEESSPKPIIQEPEENVYVSNDNSVVPMNGDNNQVVNHNPLSMFNDSTAPMSSLYNQLATNTRKSSDAVYTSFDQLAAKQQQILEDDLEDIKKASEKYFNNGDPNGLSVAQANSDARYGAFNRSLNANVVRLGHEQEVLHNTYDKDLLTAGNTFDSALRTAKEISEFRHNEVEIRLQEQDEFSNKKIEREKKELEVKDQERILNAKMAEDNIKNIQASDKIEADKAIRQIELDIRKGEAAQKTALQKHEMEQQERESLLKQLQAAYTTWKTELEIAKKAAGEFSSFDIQMKEPSIDWEKKQVIPGWYKVNSQCIVM